MAAEYEVIAALAVEEVESPDGVVHRPDEAGPATHAVSLRQRNEVRIRRDAATLEWLNAEPRHQHAVLVEVVHDAPIAEQDVGALPCVYLVVAGATEHHQVERGRLGVQSIVACLQVNRERPVNGRVQRDRDSVVAGSGIDDRDGAETLLAHRACDIERVTARAKRHFQRLELPVAQALRHAEPKQRVRRVLVLQRAAVRRGVTAVVDIQRVIAAKGVQREARSDLVERAAQGRRRGANVRRVIAAAEVHGCACADRLNVHHLVCFAGPDGEFLEGSVSDAMRHAEARQRSGSQHRGFGHRVAGVIDGKQVFIAVVAVNRQQSVDVVHCAAGGRSKRANGDRVVSAAAVHRGGRVNGLHIDVVGACVAVDLGFTRGRQDVHGIVSAAHVQLARSKVGRGYRECICAGAERDVDVLDHVADTV